MIYKNIKAVDFRDIRKFSNIYGFPDNDVLMSVFYSVNGGEPVDFVFTYEDEQCSLVANFVKKLLSYNPNDDDNIYDATGSMECDGDNIIPFALDENDNFICYLIEDESLKLYNINNGEFYNIYTINGEEYDVDSFFENIGN